MELLVLYTHPCHNTKKSKAGVRQERGLLREQKCGVLLTSGPAFVRNELNSHLICLMDAIIICCCSDPSHLELEVLCEVVSFKLPILQLRKWGQSHGQFIEV